MLPAGSFAASRRPLPPPARDLESDTGMPIKSRAVVIPRRNTVELQKKTSIKNKTKRKIKRTRRTQKTRET
jgi:hypothetical protein